LISSPSLPGFSRALDIFSSDHTILESLKAIRDAFLPAIAAIAHLFPSAGQSRSSSLLSSPSPLLIFSLSLLSSLPQESTHPSPSSSRTSTSFVLPSPSSPVSPGFRRVSSLSANLALLPIFPSLPTHRSTKEFRTPSPLGCLPKWQQRLLRCFLPSRFLSPRRGVLPSARCFWTRC